MTTRLAAAAAVLAALLAVPAGAQAAAISADRQCYAEQGDVTIAGSGFTPGASVTISGGSFSATATADAGGSFSAAGTAPATGLKHPGARALELTATEDGSGAAVATTTIDVAQLGVDGAPKQSKPHRRITWRMAGFVGGGAIYGHWRFGGRTRANHRMGVPKGPCGVLKTRARQIEADRLRYGTWKVQFDFNKRFRANATPRATVSVQVFRRLGGG